MAKMIKVMLSNATTRSEKIVSDETIIKDLLNEEYDSSLGTVHLDGMPLNGSDLSLPFSEFNIRDDKCRLSVVIKADNAA